MVKKSWKSWTGFGLVGLGTALEIAGLADIGKIIKDFGFGLLGIGIAHRIRKHGK